MRPSPERGIVDTGAPLSLIPRFVWEPAQYRLLSRRAFDLSMAGQTTTARLAQLTIRLRDDHNTSPPLAIKAYLLDDNTHLLLLGFEDVLTCLRPVSDYASRVAYLEWPSSIVGGV